METLEQPATQPSVWMVMIGYNYIADTLAAFESLQKSDYPNLHYIFVDNGSSDDSQQVVFDQVPDTDIIWIRDNIGFARSNNLGIKHALDRGADYVFMINNDVEVAPDMVSKLVEAAEASETIGLAVPKIYYFDEPEIIWSAGCRYRKFPPIIKLNTTDGKDDGRYDQLLSVDFITTCAVLIKREVIEKIGLLDPNCFLYWEDYDLSVRVREAGYQLAHVPKAHLWHKVSRTTQKGKPNPGVWKIRGTSKAVFCRSHPQYRAICFPGYPLVASLGFLLSGKSSIISAFCAGLKEGKTGPLKPIPTWTDELGDAGEVMRTV
ncbi:MAG: GT2 family glycosyltransferase [Kiritimatiellia bacterium]|jgi:GT2 family glycosyltransferase